MFSCVEHEKFYNLGAKFIIEPLLSLRSDLAIHLLRAAKPLTLNGLAIKNKSSTYETSTLYPIYFITINTTLALVCNV